MLAGKNAGCEKLAAVRLPKIKVKGGVGVFAEERCAIRKTGLEGGLDFFPDGVAAGADGGSDSGNHVVGMGAERGGHMRDSVLHNAGDSASPARVEGSDDALLRVGDENGNAVRGLDAQESSGRGGEKAVGFLDSTACCVHKLRQ